MQAEEDYYNKNVLYQGRGGGRQFTQVLEIENQAKLDSKNYHSLKVNPNEFTQDTKPSISSSFSGNLSPKNVLNLFGLLPIPKTTSTTNIAKDIKPIPKFNPNKQYLIQSQLDKNLVLDISQDSKKQNQVIIWKKHGEKNQRFKIIEKNGRYTIVSCSSMKKLMVSKNSQLDGAQIFASGTGQDEGELWHFQPVQENLFFIGNWFNKYLDVFQERKKKGTPVILWQFHGKNNQKWRIIPL